MDFESEVNVKNAAQNIKFAQPSISRKPLELLRDTEALLRRPTVTTLAPILPPKISNNLQMASSLAEESLKELAEIDLEQISDWELRPARIRVGLSFVGFGALMIVLLLLYLNSLHPELTPVEQIGKYWYQYVWFVCLGVAGMFILGREAMRPTKNLQKPNKR
ncbi:hypothetical protein [Fischerella sp. PCC 9605]|uniref:hypothetical protein n=1 Tax=Fischerella sp. PCC 9605 TaxID=1173024 RepID=UPI00047B100C|nr:hypothetical protein [Fischerella sp. PCC 9605]